MIDFDNFDNFDKLKDLNIDIHNFLKINSTSLEKLTVNKGGNITDEIKMIEKILLLKSLKYINFTIYRCDSNIISKIKGINTSVTKMIISWNNIDSDCILFDLQNKFPNLSVIKIFIHSLFRSKKLKRKAKLEIIENSNCKINKFELFASGKKKIKFFCGPFENLKKVSFDIDNNTINLKDGFPIFNDKCKKIFKSLISFEMSNCCGFDLTYEVLTNLYNNINKMPNLKKFKINSGVDDIKEEFYTKFIKKLLKLKLDIIYFSPRINYCEVPEKYTINELKKLNNNINEDNYKEIYISKFS